MPVSRRTALLAVMLIVLAAGAAWYVAHRVDRTPVTVASRVPEHWTIVTSDGTDPWMVAVKPPDSLVKALFDTVSARAGTRLVAPAHPAVPLVLRPEFDESLQGAFGVDSVQRLAADLGLDRAGTFEPVCLAHRTVRGVSGDAELYFVPFRSTAFNELRVNLTPEHPEQAGIGIYDPSILTPVLVVGATENAFERWWPLAVDEERDCEAPVARAE